MTPLDDEHNRVTRERLAEMGIEMTPDELVAERSAAYATIRKAMREKGYKVPDDDVALFEMLKRAKEAKAARAVGDLAFEHGVGDEPEVLYRVIRKGVRFRREMRSVSYYGSEEEMLAAVAQFGDGAFTVEEFRRAEQ